MEEPGRGVRLLDLNRRKGAAAVPSPKNFFSRVVTYIPGAVAVRPLHVEGRVLEGPGNIGGAVRPSPAAVPACGSLCQSCRRLDLSGKISAGRGSTDEKPRPILHGISGEAPKGAIFGVCFARVPLLPGAEFGENFAGFGVISSDFGRDRLRFYERAGAFCSPAGFVLVVGNR